MKRFTATVLSSVLALGAASAQAALPDEATLYQNPSAAAVTLMHAILKSSA
ncbi:hypothetical protein HAALTHF_53050n [Vreelandella aquamarina]|nr:hypothetical protein HAALTHF_53050n [Halomonas axialensis]